MNTLTVVNIKCGGCEKKIIQSLTSAGLSNISIDIPAQQISFDGDTQVARTTLAKLGYPEAGTPDANSLIKKGHSFISCAIGRMS